ncbi:MAG: peptidylprolyl isomerase [Candidatus Moranbacteria bacterium]|nr:peptidylprolyl isomerase [Candidatus Moranbacteria bacterium]
MNMKLLATAAAVLLLSGCSQEAATPQKTTPEADSAVSKAIDTVGKSRETVDDATAKKNAELAQGMPEEAIPTKDTKSSNTSTDMQHVNQYDGATLHTSQGDITVKFYNDASPITVNNFLKLASDKFYDGTRFHRVIKDFMIQGGDPNSKDADWSNDGTGGPGYAFADEFNKHALVKGSLAMANSGPNTNGSQFFIVTAASTPWLDGKHTNFGEVTGGMDVVSAIEDAKVNANDHPLTDITIKSIDLIKKK